MRLLIFFLLFSCAAYSQEKICVPKEAQQNIGLKTVELNAETLEERIMAYGLVVDPHLLLNLRASWISAYSLWEKSKAALSYALIDYERQKSLFGYNQSVSEKMFQQAELAYLTSLLDEKGAQALLFNLQETLQAEWGSKIKEWIVNGSSELELFSKGELALLQISLSPQEVLESMPNKAVITLSSHVVNEISFLSPSPKMSPFFQNRTFFYLAQNSNSLLFPGMNVQAYIPSGQVRKGVIVPLAAVVTYVGKSWVYVQIGPEDFIRKEISTNIPVQGGWFIEKPLKAKDRIVVVGTQELLSSELISEIGAADND